MQYDITTMGQVGSQLATTFRVFDNAIVNPDILKISDYEKMLDTDETVAQGYDFLVLGVLNKLGEYEHENAEICTFINQQVEKMNGSLLLTCQEILSAIWAGFSVTEVNFNLSEGRVGVDSLATYNPITIYFNVDDKGRLLENGIKQFMLTGSSVDIPTSKCIIYTHNKRFGNMYGKSGFKRAYKNWVLKDPILKMWARALDRFGTPLVVAMVPEGVINDPDDPKGDKIEQIDYVIRILKDLQNQTALAMTSQGTNSGDIKTLSNGGAGVGDAFDLAVSYLNKMIYRGLLLPSLVGDEGSSGSYSLGQKHFDTFQAVLDSIYNNLTEALIEQLVRRLIDFNFGKQNNYGSFPQRKLSEADKKILSDIFGSMIDKGVLDPEVQADFDYMRSTLDMPKRDVNKPEPPALEDYNLYLREGENNGQPG